MSYIYNVTVSVSEAIEKEWSSWMKEVHIPEVLNTGCFSNARMMKLVEGNQGPDPTFAIQYEYESTDQLEKYRNQFAEKLQNHHTERYEGQFAAFRTVLVIVD